MRWTIIAAALYFFDVAYKNDKHAFESVKVVIQNISGFFSPPILVQQNSIFDYATITSALNNDKYIS